MESHLTTQFHSDTVLRCAQVKCDVIAHGHAGYDYSDRWRAARNERAVTGALFAAGALAITLLGVLVALPREGTGVGWL